MEATVLGELQEAAEDGILLPGYKLGVFNQHFLSVFEEVEQKRQFQIEDVSDWRSLGKHLGIESSKLDEIGRHSIEEQKTRLVMAWFESDEDCTWEKLEEALKKPAVSEIRAAEKVRKASLLIDRSPCKDSFEAISPTSTQGMTQIFILRVSCESKFLTLGIT